MNRPRGDVADVTDLLLAQHHQIRGLLDHLDDSGTDLEDLYLRTRRMLVLHEAAEELVLYPRLEGVGGERVAADRVREEMDARRILDELEETDTHSEDFRRLLVRLRDRFAAHTEAEEREAFPLLHTACTAAELSELTDEVDRVESTEDTPPPRIGSDRAPFAPLAPRLRRTIAKETA